MRAILIDPKEQMIVEVGFSGKYDDMKALIEADMAQGIVLADDETMWVDEEFLVNHKSKLPLFWNFAGYPTPLGGKALITGTSSRGSGIKSTKVGQLTTSSLVTFRPALQFVGMKREELPGDAEYLGSTFKVIGTALTFKYPWVGICAPKYPEIKLDHGYELEGETELTKAFIDRTRRRCLAMRNDLGLSIRGHWQDLRPVAIGGTKYQASEFITMKNVTGGIVLFAKDFEFDPRSLSS